MKKCPVCNVFMNEVSKVGVLIDVCPECRGTWLDRGELDKVLEQLKEAKRDWEEDYRHRPDDRSDRKKEDYRRHSDEWQHKKKKSRWTEIFDIFD